MFAVVREQARVEFGIRGVALRASTAGGIGLHLAYVHSVGTCFHGGFQVRDVAQHMDHALAMLQRCHQALPQQRFVRGVHFQTQHRQFNRVFFEAV